MQQMLTRRPDGLTYLGGRRFGLWLYRAPHRLTIVRGTRRFFEVGVRGRFAGVCW